MQSRDTAVAARDAQCAALRRLGPARRVELAFEMSEQAREISLRGAMARDPVLTREAAREQLLRRLLGDALYRAAWPARAER